ncbi:MAG: toxin-antitoxin system YwqK family antitoxin [Myxococcaceae bacterium]
MSPKILLAAVIAAAVVAGCRSNPPPPVEYPLYGYKPPCPPPPEPPAPPPPPPPKEELACPDAGIAQHESHEWVCVDEEGKRDGPYREFFPTEVKALRDGQYAHGEKSGTWISFHPNGTPEARGEFVRDRAAGRWQYFSESGARISTADFKDGKYDGLVCEWSERGANTSETGFKADRKHGTAITWSEDGKVESIARFEDGKQVKLKPFEETQLSFHRIHYCELEPCPEGTMLVGEVVGNGVGCSGKDDTKKNGRWTYFDSEGRKIEEGDYRNDEKVGEWRQYDPDGSIRKTETYQR